MSNTPQHAGSRLETADRRRHSRLRTGLLSYIELGRENGGIILNISEGGLALTAAAILADDRLPNMRFQLPEFNRWIQTSGHIVWATESRKEAGVRFVELSEDARSQIKRWISLRAIPNGIPGEKGTVRAGEEQVQGRLAAHESADRLRDSVTSRLALREASGAEQKLVSEPPPVQASTDRLQEPAMPEAVTGGRTRDSIPSPSAAAATHGPAARAGDSLRIFHISGPASRPEPRLTGPTARDQVSVGGQPRKWFGLVALVSFIAFISFAVGIAIGRGSFWGALERIREMAQGGSSRNHGAGLPTAVGSASKPQHVPEQASNRPSPSPARPASSLSIGNMRPSAPENSLPPSQITDSSPESPVSDRTVHPDAEAIAGFPVEASPGSVLSLPETPVSASPTVAITTRMSIPVPLDFRPQASQEVEHLRIGHLYLRVDPAYPPEAEQQHIEGTVSLRAAVGADGTIRSLEPVSGPPLLIPAAMTAIRQWRYEPTYLDGQPVETREDIIITFRLP